MDNQDRLSVLPDGVLLVIISLLPFKEAVRTSVVARRWRYIPVGTRTLEFDERDFVPKAADSDEEARQNQRRAFLDFVTGWIRNYQDSAGPVKFGLAFSRPEDHRPEMEHLVGFAVDRRVKVLDLDFSDPEWDENVVQHHQPFLRLPVMDDQHKRTLESLRLFSCTLPQISQASQNFAALKSVHLGWIELPSDFIKILMEKCPALETLSTKNCSHADYYFEVIGPRLKTLVLDKCSGARPDMRILSIMINAPELRVFKYSGVLSTFEFEELGLLEEADLDFGLHGEYGEYGDILCGLLVEIASVRTLTISSYMLQAIPSGEEPLKLKPPLGCVNHLILKTSLDRSEFYGITFFLNSCPNLEVLTIDLTSPNRIFEEYDPPFGMEQHAFLTAERYQPNYTCVRSKLKSVQVVGFKGEPNELVVLRYLLKHAKVLEELRIHISKERGPDGESMEETYVTKLRSLENFQVASKRLRIFLHRR